MRMLLAQDADEADTDIEPLQALLSGLEDAVEGFLAQLPQILLGLVAVVLFVFLSKAVASVVRRGLDRTMDRSASFSNVISRLVRSLVVVGGLLLGLIIAIPSVNLAAVIGSLGIGSVALGFAFSDILQNSLAGLLMLFRQPFEIGDQIEVTEYTGTVEAITIRETRLKQFDGQLILIPNSVVYSSSVRVQTAYEQIRVAVVVGVDYDSDLDAAQQVCHDAVRGVSGVLSDPEPQVYYTQLNTSTVDLDVRFWCASSQATVRAVQDRVVRALVSSLNEAGIGMPADIVELDARLSFAEAVRVTRGTTNFAGMQNGQSQVARLSDDDLDHAVPPPPT